MLHAPYKGDFEVNIPGEICSILQVSNGIEETMLNPKTGERMPITWILYSYEEIIKD